MVARLLCRSLLACRDAITSIIAPSKDTVVLRIAKSAWRLKASSHGARRAGSYFARPGALSCAHVRGATADCSTGQFRKSRSSLCKLPHRPATRRGAQHRGCPKGHRYFRSKVCRKEDIMRIHRTLSRFCSHCNPVLTSDRGQPRLPAPRLNVPPVLSGPSEWDGDTRCVSVSERNLNRRNRGLPARRNGGAMSSLVLSGPKSGKATPAA